VDTEMQNNNESLNTLIWNFTSKHLHCAAKMIEIATFLAVIIFNEGFVSILKIRDVMGVTIGKWKCTHTAITKLVFADQSSVRLISEKNQQAQLRDKRAALHDMYEKKEDALYSFGIAD